MFNNFISKTGEGVKKYCTTGQATDDNIIGLTSIACRIIKATNTRSDYVILITLPQQWLRKPLRSLQNSSLESSCVVVALIEYYSTSKPLKRSPEKSQILSCDTLVANGRCNKAVVSQCSLLRDDTGILYINGWKLFYCDIEVSNCAFYSTFFFYLAKYIHHLTSFFL